MGIALGLGTMIGWKRIVVTVGEKIGKTHLTYAQGACAEITAAATIAAADGYGLPVSTTHVLSSGICRHHGGLRVRAAVVDDPQHRAGLGADIAGRDDRLGHAVSAVFPDTLGGETVGPGAAEQREEALHRVRDTAITPPACSRPA